MTDPLPSLEVVLAHYSEDVEWRNALPWRTVLVSKTRRDADIFVAENVGHEALCYLEYLVQRYPDFADYVAFVHAHENSDHQEFPTPALLRHYRLGQFDYANLSRRDWYSEFGATGKYANEYQWVAVFWRAVGAQFLGPLPERIHHYASAQFVVSRDRILARPREFYAACAAWLRTAPMPNYQTGRVFEYIWHVIMGELHNEPRRTREEVWNFPRGMTPRLVAPPPLGGWTWRHRVWSRVRRILGRLLVLR